MASQSINAQLTHPVHWFQKQKQWRGFGLLQELLSNYSRQSNAMGSAHRNENIQNYYLYTSTISIPWQRRFHNRAQETTTGKLLTPLNNKLDHFSFTQGTWHGHTQMGQFICRTVTISGSQQNWWGHLSLLGKDSSWRKQAWKKTPPLSCFPSLFDCSACTTAFFVTVLRQILLAFVRLPNASAPKKKNPGIADICW